MRVLRWLSATAALAALGSLAFPVPALAQATSGTIDGRVVDESQAVVPGVTITARNEATGLTRSVTVSQIGTYRIPSLPTGSYEVTAAVNGFATQVRKGVQVQVATTTTADFTMKVASVAETVQVQGETPLVATTTSDVGQVITTRMVENIPLNGRKFQDLSLLVPGTRPANYYDPTKTEVGGISYGAGGGRNVIISVDGADDNDGVVRGILQQFSADAIEEYKVTTQHYSAEYGRSTGGLVDVVTKSGTNDFHGTFFGFGRNENLNSKTFFQEKQDIAKPPFKQYQYGGTVGGPIQKDKAFFFVSYERNQRDDYQTVDTNGLLPSQEGNFPQPFTNNLLTAKLNAELGSNNSLVARYALEDNKRTHDFIGGNTLASAGALNTNKIHSGVVKDTTVLSNNKLNEFVVTYQHFENNITAENNTEPGITTPDFVFGANLNTPQQTIQQRIQLRDDFSFRKEGWGGVHDFKVGAEMLRSHYGGYFTPTLYGEFIFNHSLGSDLNTYLNSIADTFTGSAGTNSFDDNWTYVAGYVQDDWKPNRKLTINLGLRYEIQYGPYENRFVTPANQTLSALGYDTQKKNDLNNIGPRVGFAYDVRGDGKAVIRGGYGRYYDEIFQNITLYEYWSQISSPTNFISLSPPPFTPAQYAANRDAFRESLLDPTFKGQQIRYTAPDLKQPSADQFNAGFSIQPANHLAFDVDYVHTTGHDEIARWRINTAQNVSTRLSPAGIFDPLHGPYIVEGNRGHSQYDGVYLTAKWRAPKQTLIATYAWSRAYNLADDFNTLPSDITNANWEQDWGPTPNDITHRFTAAAVFDLPAHFQFATSLQGNTGKPVNALAGLGGLSAQVRAIDPATNEMFPRNAFRAGPESICALNPDGTVDKAACPQGGTGGLAFLSWDARLSYLLKLGGARNLEFLFEVFNLTNHVNFNTTNPGGYINRYPSASFGTPTDIVSNTNRQAEFGVRFRF
ncbi:MAG TPA: carboxypeptidase regulatory-like domain-containing protein [Vicinamibacteria bacterium]|nr:carboxypeptidase regulatory-like domain-containing protein [Vicinamibacteria bacterium]